MKRGEKCKKIVEKRNRKKKKEKKDRRGKIERKTNLSEFIQWLSNHPSTGKGRRRASEIKEGKEG